jgi:hypothetical protein
MVPYIAIAFIVIEEPFVPLMGNGAVYFSELVLGVDPSFV